MEWLYFIAGILMGIVIVTLILIIGYRPLGTLRIDRHNFDNEVYRIDLSENFERAVQKRFVTLSVDNNADLSQK